MTAPPESRVSDRNESKPRGAEVSDIAGQDAGAVHLRWNIGALPGVAVLAFTFVIPMAFLFVYSLFRDVGKAKFIPDLSVDNYVKFLTDTFYLHILYDTFALSFMVAFFCALLGYPVAYVLARTHSQWRGVLIFMVAAPLLISVVIRNLGWLPILGLNGLVNKVLLSMGILDQPVSLLNNEYGVVIGLVHALLPFMILVLLTVIQRIHPSIEEAATNLGASWFYSFWRVLLPLSRRGLLAGFVLVFTVSVSSYTTPAVLGGRRVLVMSTFIEQQVNFVLAYAFGAACSIILMIVAVALTLGVVQRLERDG